jgi:outer membrane immunogenic protein
METLRRGAVALAIVVGSAMAALPASADRGGPPPGADRANYPAIWQGLYAGLHLGQGESGPADGLVGGAQIGYNWQAGQIVYGVEADVSFADISFEQSFMGATVNASIDWMATLRGRLGFLVTPNVLVYGTAGFGYANASGSANLPGVLKFTVSDSESDFVFGLGLEGRLTNNMSARIEYLSFSDLEIDIVRAGVNFKLGN